MKYWRVDKFWINDKFWKEFQRKGTFFDRMMDVLVEKNYCESKEAKFVFFKIFLEELEYGNSEGKSI